MQCGHDQTRAGSAERVADGNRAAIDVDLGRIPAHLLVDGNGLCGERFVDFHQVQVLCSPAGLLQAQLGRRHRTHAHDARIETGRRIRLDLGQYRQTEFLGQTRRTPSGRSGPTGQRASR